MNNFEILIEKIILREGVYSNDPDDRGGETVYGIARNRHPEWEGWSVIDEKKQIFGFPELLYNLNELYYKVYDFYKQEFWDKLKLDEFNHLMLQEELFDTAVNQGVQKAANYLQIALNLLNNGQKHYPDINIDGNIGQRTIGAFNAYMNTSNMKSRSVDVNIKTLVKVINGLQFMTYTEICEHNPSQEVFFYGWVNNRI